MTPNPFLDHYYLGTTNGDPCSAEGWPEAARCTQELEGVRKVYYDRITGAYDMPFTVTVTVTVTGHLIQHVSRSRSRSRSRTIYFSNISQRKMNSHKGE
jgi:hypothetical protein